MTRKPHAVHEQQHDQMSNHDTIYVVRANRRTVNGKHIDTWLVRARYADEARVIVFDEARALFGDDFFYAGLRVLRGLPPNQTSALVRQEAALHGRNL